MSTVPIKTTLLLIGNNSALAYLLNRYAEQCGCQITTHSLAPALEEIDHHRPSAIIFASLHQLQHDPVFVETMSLWEVPVLACASVSDEALARELGADDCLLHPLTYDQFCTVLTNVCPAG